MKITELRLTEGVKAEKHRQKRRKIKKRWETATRKNCSHILHLYLQSYFALYILLFSFFYAQNVLLDGLFVKSKTILLFCIVLFLFSFLLIYSAHFVYLHLFYSDYYLRFLLPPFLKPLLKLTMLLIQVAKSCAVNFCRSCKRRQA